MKKAIPSEYKKTIHDINYKGLKESGIKCLIFDLDNTLTKMDTNIPDDKTVKLIEKLKKDFNIYILSNNHNKKRLNEDQIVTDIIGGNRLKATTVLVEPLGKKDLKITSFNRFLEKKIIKRLEKQDKFKKGEYYDKRG